MSYRILLVKQLNGIKTTYSFLTVIDSTGTVPVEIIWTTDDITILDTKILELLQTKSKDEFLVVSNVDYTIDIIL